LKKTGIEKETKMYKDKVKNYTPNRCEGIEITSFVADSLRRSIHRRTTKPYKIDPVESAIQIRKIKAHKKTIYSLIIDPNEGHIFTCSADYQVKMWSAGLDLWGVISSLNEKLDTRWRFPQ
jgi:WD40 repeat protein